MGYYQCKARSQDGYSLLSRVSEVLIKHTSFDDTVISSDGVVTNKGRILDKIIRFIVLKLLTNAAELKEGSYNPCTMNSSSDNFQ